MSDACGANNDVDACGANNDVDACGANNDVDACGANNDVDACGANNDVDACGANNDVDACGANKDIDAAPAGRSEVVNGTVVFVGAGPGAADLITVRAARVIERADIVVWAASLVHEDVLSYAGPHAEIVDSSQLPMEGVLPIYERAARDGLVVARVHSGDPALWGAIGEQVARCADLGLDVEIIPGVSAFTALAAIEGLELTVPEISQSVILTRLEGGKTPMPPGETIRSFATHGTTMAIFLSAARSHVLQQELLAGGYPADTPVIIGYQVTWPDELVVHCTVADLAATTKAHKLWKHTLFLVGPGLGRTATRSHLYHPGHFHGFRKADRSARRELKGPVSQS